MPDYTSWRIKRDRDKKAQKLKRDLGLKSNDDLVAFLLASQNVETLREWKDKINELHAEIRAKKSQIAGYEREQTEMAQKKSRLEVENSQLNAQLKDMEKLRSALESCKKEKSDLEETVEQLSSNEMIGKNRELQAKVLELEKQLNDAKNRVDVLEKQISEMEEPNKLYDEKETWKRTSRKHADANIRLNDQYKKLASDYYDLKVQYDRLFDVHFRTRKPRRKKQ